MTDFSRRRFLRGAGALSFAGGTGLLNMLNAPGAWAADTTGYKALVCVFLKGGMDNFDTILPKDQESWNDFRTIRQDFLNTYPGGADASTRAVGNILELNADNAGAFGGRRFGLPAELSPLRDMFEGGDLAVVGNVGPLVEPGTRSAFDSGQSRRPARLFSHNDQQSTWMALATEGTRYGWGGRFADAAIRSNTTQNPDFTAIAAAGHDNFLAGEIARQYSVPFGGPSEIRFLRQRYLLGNSEGADTAREGLRTLLSGANLDRSNLYQRDVIDAYARALDLDQDIRDARETVITFTTPFPSSSLGKQLQTIAETIAIRQTLNVSRQVFYATTGGFDTHSGQAASLSGLHGNIAACFDAFAKALQEMGVFSDVTTFTASDFGRTLVINGDGSDHGWAGHHFVMGGAVRGKNLYGGFPLYEPEGESFIQNRGRGIPDVSVDQYAATMGKWFGLTDGELDMIFPNLPNFDARDLGFMG